MESENNFKIEQFKSEVLREYDIRGIVDVNLSSNTAYTIGRTFGHILFAKSSKKKIVVGYDGRITSPKLHNALVAGLLESGLKVISIGLCPTPMVYFAHYHLSTDAIIMVTGSHNPAEYNGFKIVLNKNSFFAEKIQNLQKTISLIKDEKKEGKLFKVDIKNEYVNRNYGI